MVLELVASLGEALSTSQWERIPSSLKRILEKLCGRIQELEEELARLKEKNEDQREELASDSSNSSKPPSSDRGKKPLERCGTKSSGRQRGGQPGHVGQARKLFAPEECQSIEDVYPEECRHCGGCDLENCDEPAYRHQVLEIPPIELQIVEYRLHWLGCVRCGEPTRAKLPEGVSEEGFGPRLTALIVHFGTFLRASYRSTQALMEDLFQVSVALGTIRKIRQRVSDALATRVEEVKRYIQQSELVYLDETSYKQGNSDGKNPKNRTGWLWVAATFLVAYFEIRLSRGAQVAKDLLGVGFSGIVSTDRYKGYDWTDPYRRQLCWAHLSRNFKKISERPGRSREIGVALLECTARLFEEWYRVRDGTIKDSTFRVYASRLRREIRELLEEGASYEVAKGEKSARAKTARSCAELLKLEPAMWLFTRREGIEPTNNFAEQLLRFPVLWRRMSHGTQSEHGSLFVGRLLTVVQTLRLQDRNVLEYLTQACEAAHAGTEPASLLPQGAAEA